MFVSLEEISEIIDMHPSLFHTGTHFTEMVNISTFTLAACPSLNGVTGLWDNIYVGLTWPQRHRNMLVEQEDTGNM